jgi:hypothetical protein
VVDTLKAAFVEGRLTKDELDARAGQAFAARTYADLAALTADIPAGSAGARLRPEPAWVQARPSVSKRAIVLRLAACAIILPIVLTVVILSNNEDLAKEVISPLVVVYLMASMIGVSHLVNSRLECRRSRQSYGEPPPRRAGHRLAAGAAPRLAQVFWHLESVADRPPDGLDVYPVRESALDRMAAEFVEHEVLGHALRIPLAELRVHPGPEFGQPHVARVLPAPDQTCAADKPVRAGDRSRDDPETFCPMCRY